MDGLHPISDDVDLDPPTTDTSDGSPGRRLKLWELPKGYHCSIIGTCLSQEELVKALPRVGLRPAENAAAYEVHGFFVEKAGSDNPVARLMHKMLDQGASGELRRFAKAGSLAELSDLWERANREGRIAPAYWALLSHPLATPTLRTNVHGEVHMLSHHMAGMNRQHLSRRTAAERRCQELTDAYEKLQRASADQINTLRKAVEALRSGRRGGADQPGPAPRPAGSPDAPGQLRKLADRLARAERKLTVERARARAAEAELDRLKAAVNGLVMTAARAEPEPEPEPRTGAADGGVPEDFRGRSILYVGGRVHTVHHLKTAASRLEAELLHHDGGMEDNVRTLDALVERCDMVCCPIDFISHDACKRAKQLCKRHRKPFLPLRSSGAATFFVSLRQALGRPDVN